MTQFHLIPSTVVFVMLSVTQVWAAHPELLFSELKNSGENFDVTGVICEQAARLDFQKQYPAPDYEVTTGIAYADTKHTIGELDVIVFNTHDKRAILVGEVKCWRDLEQAMKKAILQRTRFMEMLQKPNGIFMFSTKNRKRYDVESFKELKNFITISQQGGEKSGFTYSLSYTLEELMSVRSMIMGCQSSGACVAPDSHVAHKSH